VGTEPDGSTESRRNALHMHTRTTGSITMKTTTKSLQLMSVIGTLASLAVIASARPLTPSPVSVAAAQAPVAIEAVAAPAPVFAAQTPVFLGLNSSMTILAKAGISTTGSTSIVGNIGVSPIDSTAVTGFGLTLHPSNLFSTSSLVTGMVLAPDYALRTGRYLNRAVLQMEHAYTDAAGRTLPDATELGAGNIGGMTLAPGLYKWGTGVLIPSNGVTLAGSSTDVWIFQIAQDLTVSDGAIVTLSGGALPGNVFWQVAGQAVLGTTVQFRGVILCQTQIVMNTGATLHGRALAQTAVTLDANTITPN
jgi:hypothetical protein